MSKSYFGDKEVLEVILGGKTIYKKVEEGGGGELPPPEKIYVPKSSFLNASISYSEPPTEEVSYSRLSLMTNWVAVRPNSHYLIEEYMTNACVIQVKNSSGTITNLTQFEGLRSVKDVVFPTGNNVFVRIYFYSGTNGSYARDLTLTEQRS